MPTFTAVAVDRLLEPGASRSSNKSVSHTRPPCKQKHIPKSNLERRHNSSSVQGKVLCPQIKPSLYATPKATPLPGSPTSFAPSPYIINHKQRGPRLLKSFSEDNVATYINVRDELKPIDTENEAESESVDFSDDISVSSTVSDPSEMVSGNGVNELDVGSTTVMNGRSNEKHWENNVNRVSNNMVSGNNKLRRGLDVEVESVKPTVSSPRRKSDSEEFFDPQDSSSYRSNTDGEDNNTMVHSFRSSTTAAEFYDAFEELSSDGGTQSFLRDVDAELREMRLNLLMEIGSRKQAEEALDNMKRRWEKTRQQLLLVGLTVPADLTFSNEYEHLDVDLAEDLCRQVTVTRFVSESVGRGIAKAEAEVEMETQLESKNFEIARLMDRLHYYEAVNREMSQRNQEAIEMVRRNRKNRERKQKWLWGSIAAVITLGTAALLWCYLPSSDGTSTRHSEALENDETSNKS